jgi:hypothetical protein
MIHALALDQKLPKTLELRDQFESFHSWDYTQFLVKLFPVFENLIATIVPSFTSTDDAQVRYPWLMCMHTRIDSAMHDTGDLYAISTFGATQAVRVALCQQSAASAAERQ